jgi:ABC-2 type transport system ATP-binding protein
MQTPEHAIEIQGLVRRYGRVDAVNGLDLVVRPGRCYGFFGRNGAGKTTTIKCLLNLLRPTAGSLRVFGSDPQRDEVAVKSRLTYVPDQVTFYPWMTIRELFDYLAAFRPRWNRIQENQLLEHFGLDPLRKVNALSRGETVQAALIGAICPEPELLVLDEPTSGLDPLVRREFIRAVIGAYQEADPERRTVFVSTHLISEFEGLIDEFTIIDRGRAVLNLQADQARDRFRKIRATFAGQAPPGEIAGALRTRRDGRELEVLVDGEAERVLEWIRRQQPEAVQAESLSLEEVFLATVGARSV